MQNEQVFLYSTKDGADKEYHLYLTPDPKGSEQWLLRYANGPRGRVKPHDKELTTYEAAKKEYDRIYKSKLKDGYSRTEGGLAYQDTAVGERFTGIQPQLLNEITQDELQTMLLDPRYTWEEKMDGERRPIRKVGDVVTGTNRDGLAVPIPKILEDAVRALPIENCDLDGEYMQDGRYAAFSFIKTPNDPEGKLPYTARRAHMLEMLQAAPSPCWIKVLSADSPKAARALLQEVISRNGEGIVGKLANTQHSPGRPNSGGDHLKFKLWESATVIVEKHNGLKRSVGIAALSSNGMTVPLGNVTIPPNHKIPSICQVVEVRYLYATKNNKLFEPTYKGVRGDMNHRNCTLDQLKYKPDAVCIPLVEQVLNRLNEEDDEEEIATQRM